jgi:hypothetical protein
MNQTFTGTLTARDCKRHLPHAFTVPEGCQRVSVQLTFTPARVANIGNMLTLTLFDAQGFRGAGHRGGAVHPVEITPTTATPGYNAGLLPAGEWIAQIDTHMIMPGEPITYTLTVACDVGEPASPAAIERLRPSPVLTGGPGWLRGDLHSHTDHSDAAQSIEQLVAAAQRVGLDFLFLTDHNTVSGLAEMARYTTPTFLAAGGLELTTFWGHALVLGTREWIDWRIRPGTGAITQIAEQATAAGQLFIIAHPQAVGDPLCTGCIWRYGEQMPGSARLVEIWNGPWGGDSYNPRALDLWYDWLNQGIRIYATAGTDTHGPRDYTPETGFNVVYVHERSEKGILQALAAGCHYLSNGPTLEVQAEASDGTRWQLGETVDRPATVTCRWSHCPPDATLRVMVNGRLLQEQPSGEAGELQWQLSPQLADWTTVEIWGANGDLLAITNPIFWQA